MRARIDAEGPGPLGRSENAMQSSKTSHLLKSERKKNHGWGRGVAKARRQQG